ncbi:outer membrane protein [Campylobacter geochelonis]|nr:outer membrane protein [Campylobacter geochelonis]
MNKLLAENSNAIAIGTGAQATAENSISIGTGNIVSGENSGAFGDPNEIASKNSYAFGNNNKIVAKADNNFILGNNVKIEDEKVKNSVFLGNDTAYVASGETTKGLDNNYIGITVKNSKGIEEEIKFAGGDKVVGVVSVGSVDGTRRIQNVAPGLISETSTDAINGSQLYALNTSISKAVANSKIHYVSINRSINGNGNYDNDGAGTHLDSLAIGVNASASDEKAIAIGSGAQVLTYSGISMGYMAGNASEKFDAQTKKFNTFIGHNTGGESAGGGNTYIGAQAGWRAMGTDGSLEFDKLSFGKDSGYNTAVGNMAGQKSLGAKNTYLGYGAGKSVNGTKNVMIGYEEYGGMVEGSGNIFIGDTNNNGQKGNDPILYKVSNAVSIGNGSKAVDNAVAIGSNSTADRAGYKTDTVGKFSNKNLNGITYGAVSVGGEVTDNGKTTTYLRQIINVGDGVQATDAVNVRQLTGTQKNLARILGGKAKVGDDGLVDVTNYKQGIGNTGKYTIHDAIASINTTISNNNTNITDIKAEVDKGFNIQTDSSTTENIAMGDTVTINGDSKNITVTNEGKTITVSLADDIKGIASLTTNAGIVLDDGGINLGKTGKEKKITGLADGEKPNDAVNYSQLQEVKNQIGTSSTAVATNPVSVKTAPTAKGDDSLAVGMGAKTTNNNSVALGTNATSSGKNSVALGAGSNDGGRANTVSVGSAGKERTISNVAAGVYGTDAVNLNQLNAGLQNVYNQIGEYQDEARAGTASAIALGSLGQATIPGKGMFGVGGGSYQGQSAVSVGVSKMSDDGKWVFKAGASYDSQRNIGTGASINFHF